MFRQILIIILIMFFQSFYQCTSIGKLNSHLIELNKINSHISLSGWSLVQEFKWDFEYHYNLKRQGGNISQWLNFMHVVSPDTNYYHIFRCFEYYTIDDCFYQTSFINCDTLYSFIYKNPPENFCPGGYVHPDSLDYIVGKYYYMYKYGFLSIQQIEYFKENRDSLIRIRGNDLPELPEINLRCDG